MQTDRYPDRETTYVGADDRQIRRQEKDDDGVAIDLSVFANGTISAQLGSSYKITAETITIEAGTDGWWAYTPTALDIATKGEYKTQPRFVTGGGSVDYGRLFILDVLAPIHSA